MICVKLPLKLLTELPCILACHEAHMLRIGKPSTPTAGLVHLCDVLVPLKIDLH